MPTAREQRLWYYLNKTQDVFWPISKWPEWVQHIALLEHKNDSQMYNLMFFYLANGLPAYVARHWTMAAEIKPPGVLVFGPYSKKEEEDIRRVIIKHNNGLLYTGKKKVFDMIEGRPVLM